MEDGYGDYDFYKQVIHGYWVYREDNAEISLLDKEVQQALDAFDSALRQFTLQLSTYADAEPTSTGKWKWVAHYKDSRLKEEFYNHKVHEYENALERGQEMLRKHQAFVDIARSKYPEFVLRAFSDANSDRNHT